MAKMSKGSLTKLISCHPKLIKVIDRLNREIVVIEGHRSIERQRQLIKEGKSSLKKAENGYHIKMPSMAVDIAPLINGTIFWENKEAFAKLADEIKKVVEDLNKEAHDESEKIKITWGGDWDHDGDWKDEKFLDMVHFQLEE